MYKRQSLKCIARHVRYAHSGSKNSLKAFMWYDAHTFASKLFTFNTVSYTHLSRHDVTAVGVLDLLGHILGVAGLFQQAQLIAEPLDGRTGHENRAFQRIIHLAVGAAGDGGDKTDVYKRQLSGKLVSSRMKSLPAELLCYKAW